MFGRFFVEQQQRHHRTGVASVAGLFTSESVESDVRVGSSFSVGRHSSVAVSGSGCRRGRQKLQRLRCGQAGSGSKSGRVLQTASKVQRFGTSNNGRGATHSEETRQTPLRVVFGIQQLRFSLRRRCRFQMVRLQLSLEEQVEQQRHQRPRGRSMQTGRQPSSTLVAGVQR